MTNKLTILVAKWMSIQLTKLSLGLSHYVDNIKNYLEIAPWNKFMVFILMILEECLTRLWSISVFLTKYWFENE